MDIDGEFIRGQKTFTSLAACSGTLLFEHGKGTHFLIRLEEGLIGQGGPQVLIMELEEPQ